MREDASREGVRDLPEWLQLFTEELTGGASSSESGPRIEPVVGSIPTPRGELPRPHSSAKTFQISRVGNTVYSCVLRKTPIARYASARKLQERLAEVVWKAKWTEFLTQKKH